MLKQHEPHSIAIAVGCPASADSLQSVVRTLNAIVNPEDAWRLEDQARRYHRTNEESYWRNYGAGLEQQRRERGEPVPPRGGWHGYSTPIDPDEAYAIPGAARWSFSRGTLLGSLSPRARRARTATVIVVGRLGSLHLGRDDVFAAGWSAARRRIVSALARVSVSDSKVSQAACNN